MPGRPSVGYSGTPLARKLGIQSGHVLWVLEAPAGYDDWIAPLPPNVVRAKQSGPTVDIAHLFLIERTDLARHLHTLRTRLRDDVSLWISWPKKASKVPTSITEDVIRTECLPLGWVDVKVCAVSEVWSGLKLVVRKELRGAGR
ncbi:DUF3052 domain-containing protein [Roseateles amylovorans]|uniref:DUF3052 domain-containing protein n=1 Tax=Roseateles amylovorans TaxID=2978473 RepID=A0ABY6AV59_9BURK|nr:DUF3052 domain-containing protein [Roseateles amylovorans]UXH76562.1 DUF3052 domain-containing protein [Roseateles amylovorans]